MGPEALAQVLRPLTDMFAPADYPDLVRGLSTLDDAAVWRLDGERALALTADFFPPVVDDPYRYGAVAAANALSDLYAMGATPILALNLVGFPDDLPAELLQKILRGGGAKVREAGAVVAGGHTTTDEEPKYGLAALGLLDPQRMLTKGGALDGDRLLLTKPLGTGVITTAHRADAVDEAVLESALVSMERLNAKASKILYEADGATHACTDITGYSLLGHGYEMASQSSLTLQIDWDSLPLFDGAAALAQQGRVPGGTGRNRQAYEPHCIYTRNLERWQTDLLFDPQTSGGLFAAVAPDRVSDVERAFAEAGEPIWWVGKAVAGITGIEIV